MRNLLVGRREALEWGRLCPVVYFPDAFGNAGQMPQFLAQAGRSRELAEAFVEARLFQTEPGVISLANRRDYLTDEERKAKEKEEEKTLPAKAGFFTWSGRALH